MNILGVINTEVSISTIALYISAFRNTWNSVKGLVTKAHCFQSAQNFHMKAIEFSSLTKTASQILSECRKVNEIAMILHVWDTICIAASYTCKSEHGILSMCYSRFLRCLISFYVGGVWFCSWLLMFLSIHITQRRWPATYLVATWDCVGCTVSENQLMDPYRMLIWGGRQWGRATLLWYSS